MLQINLFAFLSSTFYFDTIGASTGSTKTLADLSLHDELIILTLGLVFGLVNFVYITPWVSHSFRFC